MTTNKPEVVSVYRTDTGGTDKMVSLSDYEALKAECERMRQDAERYRWLRDANINTLPYDDHGIGPEFPCGDDLDAAIDAAMEKEIKT